MLLYWAGMNSCTEVGYAAPGTNNGDPGDKRCGDRIWGGGGLGGEVWGANG